MLQIPEPISIYCVCPEEVVFNSDKRRLIKQLREHGFGLLTVNRDGEVQREFSAIPLIQVISKNDYKEEIEGLSKKIRQRIGQAYEDYCNKPTTGVASLTEIVEGIVGRAAADAVKRQYLTSAELGSTVAANLDALYSAGSCRNARAAIGGLRGYVHQYRNLSHHWPKNKKASYKKYKDCKHAFVDGIKQIQQFRRAMKSINLSGELPVG